jgi:hydrogenase-4 component F
MSAALALVLLHLAGVAAMAAVGAAAWARFAQAGLAAAALPVAMLAAASGGLDPLARLLVPLVALLGATSAIAAAVAPEAGRPGPARVMQAAFQGVLGAVQAALLADGLLPAWGAVQAAVIAAVLLVAAQGSAAAIAAAWRMALPSAAGLALAAFGTLLLALAAEGDAARYLSLPALRGIGAGYEPALRSLGVLLLVAGYGTVAGLVPLQGWRADAEAEAPPAMSPRLAALLPIAALATMLRGLLLAPGAEPLLLAGLGLLAVLVAAGAAWTERDARRLLALAGTLHLGLAAAGFGIGAPLAGLLLLGGHALLQGGAGPAIGWAAVGAGSRALRDVGGQVAARPALRAGVALAGAGLVGLPPFALFLGGMALLVEAASRAPLLAVGLGAGMVAAALGLLRAGAVLCVARPQAGTEPPRAIAAILWLYLLLAAIAGVFAPDALAALFADAAAVLR